MRSNVDQTVCCRVSLRELIRCHDAKPDLVCFVGRAQGGAWISKAVCTSLRDEVSGSGLKSERA